MQVSLIPISTFKSINKTDEDWGVHLRTHLFSVSLSSPDRKFPFWGEWVCVLDLIDISTLDRLPLQIRLSCSQCFKAGNEVQQESSQFASSRTLKERTFKSEKGDKGKGRNDHPLSFICRWEWPLCMRF